MTKKTKKYTVVYRNDPPFGGITFAANPAFKHIRTTNLKKRLEEDGEFEQYWFVFKGWSRLAKKNQ